MSRHGNNLKLSLWEIKQAQSGPFALKILQNHSYNHFIFIESYEQFSDEF